MGCRVFQRRDTPARINRVVALKLIRGGGQRPGPELLARFSGSRPRAHPPGLRHEKHRADLRRRADAWANPYGPPPLSTLAGGSLAAKAGRPLPSPTPRPPRKMNRYHRARAVHARPSGRGGSTADLKPHKRPCSTTSRPCSRLPTFGLAQSGFEDPFGPEPRPGPGHGKRPPIMAPEQAPR